MKAKKILCALAAAAATAAAGSAHATPLLLQDAVISASYNGAASGMLGLDHLFAQEAGSNTSRLDPTDAGVEFFTSDFLFGVDFSASGALTVIANGAVEPGAYSMRFDFGSTLPEAIRSFSFVGADGAAGVPGLSIVDAHTVALDLAGVQWSEFGSFTARIGTGAEVPEPASAAIVLAGLAAMAFAGRARKPRQPAC
jgi:hypothetical protein